MTHNTFVCVCIYVQTTVILCVLCFILFRQFYGRLNLMQSLSRRVVIQLIFCVILNPPSKGKSSNGFMLQIVDF